MDRRVGIPGAAPQEKPLLERKASGVSPGKPYASPAVLEDLRAMLPGDPSGPVAMPPKLKPPSQDYMERKLKSPTKPAAPSAGEQSPSRRVPSYSAEMVAPTPSSSSSPASMGYGRVVVLGTPAGQAPSASNQKPVAKEPALEPTPKGKRTRCQWPAAAVGSAQNLLHGAVMFTTSKLFDILFTAFYARLHAQPYCHDFLQDLYSQGEESAAELPVCPTEASSAALFHYAIVWVVPIATAVKCVADWTHLLKIKFFEDLPTILNMLVGWAFGAAFIKQLHELEAGYAADLCRDDDVCLVSSHPSPNPNPNPNRNPTPNPNPYLQVCNGFRLLYCAAVSLCCAFVISVVAPLAKDVEFGSGRLVDMVEELLEDFFAMVHRGASVTVS